MNERLQISNGLNAETWFQDECMSIAMVTLNGVNDRIVNSISDMTYEIIAGAGKFTVGDCCVVTVQVGDKISIPAGTQYHDEGKLMMLASATPPFNNDDVEVLTTH